MCAGLTETRRSAVWEALVAGLSPDERKDFASLLRHLRGGPPFAMGIYASVFRQHACDVSGSCTNDPFAFQSGAQITKNSAVNMANDYYFKASDGMTRQNVDPAANATSANGTGLLTNANVMDGLAYSGTGGITDTTNCQWENHAAANVPGLLFIQIYRKVAKLGKTCTE